MAADLSEGFVTLNPVTLKKYERHEVDALAKELEKVMRDTRAQVVPQDDAEASQARNRKLLRLSQATVVLNSWRIRMSK
jgi:hypothetical protein